MYFGVKEYAIADYRQCSVYDMPSHWKSTSITFLEAIAMGRQFVATKKRIPLAAGELS